MDSCNPKDPGNRHDLAALKAEFDRKGFVRLPCIFSREEIDGWRLEADRLWSLPEISDADSPRVDRRASASGAHVPERLDPVTDVSRLFEQLSTDPRIVNLASHLLGEQVILFKDKLIMKPPGVNGYPLHQDFAYIEFFGFKGSQQMVVCIAIDNTELATGPIEFFPFLHHGRLPSPPGRPGEADENLVDLTTGEMPELQAGDIVLFSSLCPHRSEPNRSENHRRLLFLTYNTRSSGDFYDAYYRMGKP